MMNLPQKRNPTPQKKRVHLRKKAPKKKANQKK